jgi:hypothetical protein
MAAGPRCIASARTAQKAPFLTILKLLDGVSIRVYGTENTILLLYVQLLR